MKRTILLPLCLLMLLPTSCQILGQQKKDDTSKKTVDEKPAPVYLGTIEQVYPKPNNFALLRIIGPIPPAGTVLISHPPDGTTSRLANLVVSSEKLKNSVSNMITADIRGGTAVRGDAIYLYRDLVGTAPKNQAIPENEPSSAADIPAPATTQFTGDLLPETPTLPAPQPEEDVKPAAPPKTKPADTKIPDAIRNAPDNYDNWFE